MSPGWPPEGHVGAVALAQTLHQAMLEAASARLGTDVRPLDLHVSFLAPPAGPLAVQAQATGGGRSICFCEARLADAEGGLVAQAMGTFGTSMSESANGPRRVGDCAAAAPARD